MSLDSLPDDILIEFIIFHIYLVEEESRLIDKSKFKTDWTDRLINIKLVSKKFSNLCYDKRLWTKLVEYYGVGGKFTNGKNISRRIIEARIFRDVFSVEVVEAIGLKRLLDSPIIPDFITITDGGIPIFHITPRYYTDGIMRGWNNQGVPFITFKYKVQGGLDFIGGEDGDNVEKDKYGIEIIFVSPKNGVLNSCGSRRSIYRSSFVGCHLDGELEADGPGFNWYPGGNMEFAVDRPYDINWRALRFRLFTPYCIDYIRRLVHGKDLWDVIEYYGSYKEGIGGIGGAGKLVLFGGDS